MVLLINQIVNSFYEGLSCIPQCPHCAYTRFQDPTLSSVVVISTHSSNFSQYPCLMKHENCSVTKHLQGIAHLHGRFNSLNLYSYFQCPQSIQGKESFHTASAKSNNHCTKHQYDTCNPYDGALFIICFNLAIQAGATNKHLYCDHHAFAKSADSSPSLFHGVFSRVSAANTFAIMTQQGVLPRSVIGRREIFHLKDVPSPEDSNTFRDFTIEVIHVEQHCTVSSVENLKGANEIDPHIMMEYQVLMNNDLSDKVDATAVLGHFTKENKILPPKLLLLRFTTMLSNSHYSSVDKEAMAIALYNLLRPIAGKSGYEVRRTSGTAGITSDKSDKNLLSVMDDLPSLSPRIPKGCVIIRNKFKYHILYRARRSPYTIKHVTYSPPQEGGQFKLPDQCLNLFPIVSEFSYLKMVAVLILQELNHVRCGQNSLPIAKYVIECELKKIQKARLVYRRSPADPDRKMYEFIASFNSQHTFSMVCYPVGAHHDFFKDNDESLENRILFCLPSTQGCDASGRGGSLEDGETVYALLDW